LKSKTKIITM